MASVGSIIHCYCGFKIDKREIVNHFASCREWRERSEAFAGVRSLIHENPGKAEVYKLELAAIIQSELFTQPLFAGRVTAEPVKVPEFIVKPKNPRSYDSDIELARRLAEEDEKRRREDDSLRCCLCKEVIVNLETASFLECGHFMCKSHLIEIAQRDIPKKGSISCPEASCTYELRRFEVEDLIGAAELDKLEQASLQTSMGDDIAMCPSCNSYIILEPGSVDYNYRDDQGRKLTRQAAEHMSQFRLRCPNCSNISCAKCKVLPYHLGMTCEESKSFKSARKCKYCESVIKGAGDCSDPECIERSERACPKRLHCGHGCYGTRGETECGGCLNEACATEVTERDYCPICFTEGLGSAPVVVMTCGHILHYHCLTQILSKRWVGPRITFKFAKCPSCNEWVNAPQNPVVTAQMRVILGLYEDIRTKALKRLEFEGMHNDARLRDPSDRNYFNQPERYALDSLSYYECFKCKVPYFGGKKNCEDNRDRADYNPEELVCPGCAAVGVEGLNCPSHGADYIEFKCKFCCSISAWFCWGNTHFCDSCHTKQNSGDYLNRKAKSDLPKCPGPQACPLKMRHVPNGEEQALGCAICRNMAANKQEF
jgi:E3 ubiquitin-protein ligase MYCBP2